MKKGIVQFVIIGMLLSTVAEAGILDWFRRKSKEAAEPVKVESAPRLQPIVIRTQEGTNSVVMAIIDENRNVHIAPSYTANQVILRLSDIVLQSQGEAREIIARIQQRDLAVVHKLGEALQIYRPPARPPQPKVTIPIDLDAEIERDTAPAR